MKIRIELEVQEFKRHRRRVLEDRTPRRRRRARADRVEEDEVHGRQIGEDFSGMILSVTKYGFFVELDELFLEGMVPIGSLPGDHWSFRDTDRTIVGARSGHVFKPGQRIEVILDRIDRVQRRLQFALLPTIEFGPGKSANPSSPRAFGERKKAAKQKKSTKEHKRAKKAKHTKRKGR
ncbi:MAG: S1 RNA-binding domain-containing protein [Amaricoccus sp.]|uniref:S1 RNA-binding domain-containing protein n=1 Tax=Amaricoccus sp. TaxID=1872485 RepID=UPI0039E2B729